MTTTTFTLAGAELTALPSGALWYAAEQLLCVSDLHLGKSERLARRSGMLVPPYDSQETLNRLAEDIHQWDPDQVICLGDNFDDNLSIAGVQDVELELLSAIKAGRIWTWITGNHDPGPVEVGGTWRDEITVGPLAFRHIAQANPTQAEVSGHYHPKHRLNGARSAVTRKAFLFDATRVMMPAYGAYTGGLRSSDPVLRQLFGPKARAILTGPKTIMCPLA